MSLDLLLALLGFAFVTSATPGPNTMLLLASGVNFGVRRSVPHMAGVIVGFGIMLAAVGAGLGALFAQLPGVHLALQVASIAYMLWLAWRLATTRTLEGAEGSGRPMTFLEGAAFQWINPKAWAIALAGVATYTEPTRPVLSLAIFVLVFVAINPPIVLAWTAFGVALREVLQEPRILRTFNIAMALLLVASLWPGVRHWIGAGT